jgi:uncharacterized protein YqeY
MHALQTQIADATKVAMKARDKQRVAVMRLINAEIKRFEVDTRSTPSDAEVLDILNKMLKQRRDSLRAFTEAGRDDLARQEAYEIEVVKEYMPAPLGEAEITALIAEAIQATGATGMRDMGKVMAAIATPLKGKADMGEVSATVKALLG